MAWFPTRFRSVRAALETARASPMLADLEIARPWLRFGSFLALTILLWILAVILAVLVLRVSPELAQTIKVDRVLSDSVDRLIDEGYLALGTGIVLGMMALAVLFAAAITYRRWPAEFLWPGRPPNLADFAIGFAAIAAASIAIIPYYLLTGSTWDPPILDPSYLPATRGPYVAMTVVGLFAAAAAEEIVCRGVVLRLTAQISISVLVLCVINGVLFSALHLEPDPVVFVARTISGMVWTWAAIRLGGLEFAIGAHLAGNFVLSQLAEPLSEASLPHEAEWIDLAPELVVAVVTLAVVERIALRRSRSGAERLAPR